MKTSHQIISVVVLVLVLIGLSLLKQNESGQPSLENVDISAVDTEQVIPITVSQEDGVSTYTGVVTLPTPCYDVDAEIDKSQSTEAIVLDIRAVPTPEEEACIQVITEEEFSVQAQSSSEAEIVVNLNGTEIDTEITRARSESTQEATSPDLQTDNESSQ